jgi:hypothetical protein
VPHLFAYLDPGSGSLIIQAAVAAMVSVPVIFRNRIARGARAVRRAVGRDRVETTAPREALAQEPTQD